MIDGVSGEEHYSFCHECYDTPLVENEKAIAVVDLVTILQS
jgi:hypothetical protein